MGFNRGEWGGLLAWYYNNGNPGGVLVRDNVVSIIPGSDSSVVLVGLSHRGARHGTAFEILEREGRFQVGRSVTLGSTPTAATPDGAEGILIATAGGLVTLSSDFSVQEVLDAGWKLLYPNSLVIDRSGTIYAGMRGVIARITRKDDTHAQEWLFTPTLDWPAVPN